MPPEGLDWLEADEQLSAGEILRVARVFVNTFGFTSVRLTGGEPTLKSGFIKIVEKLSELDVDLALTTNGTTLHRNANQLAAAGLNRINISLDTLDPVRFNEITGRDQLDTVIAGIESALAAGFDKIKLNVVAIKGVNDSEVLDFCEFGRTHGVEVRFIEFMPLDAHGQWSQQQVLPRSDILQHVATKYQFRQVHSGNAPSERYEYLDSPNHSFGIIPSVTNAFCGTCDRVRLTSDGQIRNCLFASTYLDLRNPLRSGASDEKLAKLIAGEIARKKQAHGIGAVNFVRPSKSMSQIGG